MEGEVVPILRVVAAVAGWGGSFAYPVEPMGHGAFVGSEPHVCCEGGALPGRAVLPVALGVSFFGSFGFGAGSEPFVCGDGMREG